jgi:hypothetical protein
VGKKTGEPSHVVAVSISVLHPAEVLANFVWYFL